MTRAMNPFMDGEFLLGEARRLLTLGQTPAPAPMAAAAATVTPAP